MLTYHLPLNFVNLSSTKSNIFLFKLGNLKLDCVMGASDPVMDSMTSQSFLTNVYSSSIVVTACQC